MTGPGQEFTVLPDRYARRFTPSRPGTWIVASTLTTMAGLGVLGLVVGMGWGRWCTVTVGVLLIAAGVVLYLKRPEYSHRPRYACRRCSWTGEYPYHHRNCG